MRLAANHPAKPREQLFSTFRLRMSIGGFGAAASGAAGAAGISGDSAGIGASAAGGADAALPAVPGAASTSTPPRSLMVSLSASATGMVFLLVMGILHSGRSRTAFSPNASIGYR